MSFTRRQLARLLGLVTPYTAPTWTVAPALAEPLYGGDQVTLTNNGTATGYPAPTLSTVYLVNGVDMGAGPVTVQVGDTVVARRTALNARGSTSIDSAAVTAQPILTWAGQQLLGANAAPLRDYDKTRVYCNLLHQVRNFAPPSDPYSYTSRVTLKGNGWPAAGTSPCCVFLTNMKVEDAGVYQISFTGQVDSIQNIGNGSLSAKSFNAGTGKTTATVTMPGTSGHIVALRFNNVSSDFGALEVMVPGYAPGTAQVYRTEVLAHYEPFNTIRFMDWLETNGPEAGGGGNPDVNWTGSRAADNATPLGYKHSLKACFDFAAANGAHPWTNVPVSASDSYIGSYVADGLARLQAGKRWLIEYSNELWNQSFPQYATAQDAAMAAGDVRIGADMVSCSKSGGTASLELEAPHGKTVGQLVSVQGIGNITGGLVPITAVPDPNTLRWAEAGTATGAIAGEMYSSVFLDPSNPLCAPVGGGYYVARAVNAFDVKQRWEVTRLRKIWEAVSAAGATNRVRLILGVHIDEINVTRANVILLLAWIKATYGSVDWIWGVAPAFYATPANAGGIGSVDDVFTQLDTSRLARGQQLKYLTNIVKAWGLHLVAYEGGPHTHDDDGSATIKGYIAAAHVDSRMRDLIEAQASDWRAYGGEDFMYFHAGSGNTFGGVGNNNTWPLVVGDLDDGPNQPKYQAMQAIAAASSAPELIDGVNSGAIDLIDVLPDNFIAYPFNAQFYIPAGDNIPDVAVNVAIKVAGLYTIAFDAGVDGGTVNAQLLVDGNVVDSGAIPVRADFWTAQMNEAYSATMQLSAGPHTVALRLPAANRGQWVALRRVRRTAV